MGCGRHHVPPYTWGRQANHIVSTCMRDTTHILVDFGIPWLKTRQQSIFEDKRRACRNYRSHSLTSF